MERSVRVNFKESAVYCVVGAALKEEVFSVGEKSLIDVGGVSRSAYNKALPLNDSPACVVVCIVRDSVRVVSDLAEALNELVRGFGKLCNSCVRPNLFIVKNARSRTACRKRVNLSVNAVVFKPVPL